LNEFPVQPYDCWTIHSGVVHAPGPWTTLEIQIPQDDYNLLSWRFGERLSSGELQEELSTSCLRGLADFKALVEQGIDWSLSTDADFKRRFFKRAEVLESGSWGRMLRIFFEPFYGEAIEIEPNSEWIRRADPRPFAGIVWSGDGSLNGQQISALDSGGKEFLVTPNRELRIRNSGDARLLVFVVFPIGELPALKPN